MKILVILLLAATCLAGRGKPGNVQKVYQQAGKPKSDKESFIVSLSQLDTIGSVNPEKHGNTQKRSDFVFGAVPGLQRNKLVRPSGIGMKHQAPVVPENPSFIENPKEVLENKRSSSSEESQDSDDSKQKSSSSESSLRPYRLGNGKHESSSSSESSSHSSSEEKNVNVATTEASPTKESNSTSANQEEESTNSPVVPENNNKDIDTSANNQKESPKLSKENAEPKSANKNENALYGRAFHPFVQSIGLIPKNRIRSVDTQRPESVIARRSYRGPLRSADFDIVIRNDGQPVKVREPQGRIQSKNKYVRKPSK